MIPSRMFWSGKTVCVTGGTGFVGFQVVRQLVRAGARVRSLSLRPADTHPILTLRSVENYFGDVRDTRLVGEVVARCSVVFHTAGIVSMWGPALAQMHEVHVNGTRNALDATAPDARFVHTSSVFTVGASNGRPLTEDDPWNVPRFRVDYVQAKRAAEELALAAAAQGRDVVIVNPGALIGPEDHELSSMGRFCLRFWKGRVPLAPPGGMNVVDVRDAAIGHLLAAERGKSGRRYIMGGDNVSYATLMRLMASVAGLRPRVIGPMPRWIEWLVAAGAELRAKVRKRDPYPSFQHVRLHRYTWFYDWSRAHHELGFSPRPLVESLRDSYNWFAARHSLELRNVHRFLMRPERR